jgi:5-carboxymethyl-2-hydroxymuconate isomerase
MTELYPIQLPRYTWYLLFGIKIMSQVKIYGLKEQLKPIRSRLSDTIHSCVVEALLFPADKRAHRFFHLDADDFFAPSGRTERYTIIEFSTIEGRSIETKKKLINLLFQLS